MRQGFPLSPPLYIYWPWKILPRPSRTTRRYRGIQVGGQHHKAGLYADDLLVYISYSRVTLPSLLGEFTRFEGVSNFKIMTKSTLLNVTFPPRDQKSVPSAFPFSWARDSIKYLGITIPADLYKLYCLNYHTLLLWMLGSWPSGGRSWLGWVALVKMDMLPKWLYIYRALPIAVPIAFFVSLWTALLRYVSADSPPRICYDFLTYPKQAGVLGLLNF